MMRKLGVTLLLTVMGVAALGASLSAQSLSTILPRGAQRGSELDLSFVGSSLQDPVKVLMDGEGIEVLAIKALKSSRVRVRIKVDKDCPLGAHSMWLVTKHGMTRAKTLQVGTMPEVAEVTTPNGGREQSRSQCWCPAGAEGPSCWVEGDDS